MNNILIIGATGSLAAQVIETASLNSNLNLTLLARNVKNLPKNYRTFIGDALNVQDLENAMQGIDVVYVNLAGDLATMGNNIVQAMKNKGVKRMVVISSIEIYDEPVKSILKPYRALADIIEQSGLDYTILRPNWFTYGNEVDYFLTHKGEPEQGGAVSRKSIADLVCKIFADPSLYVNENLGIAKA